MNSAVTPQPAIHLLHEPMADQKLVDAVMHGCEEEGVPVWAALSSGTAESLARAAADTSPLFIGVGIDSTSTVTLHERRLAGRAPLLSRTMTASLEARAIGVAAGRLARGRPLPSSALDDE